MRQEVNLYQDEFVPKIQWCNFGQAACLSLFFICLVAFYSFTEFQHYTMLKNKNEVLVSSSKEFNDAETPDSLIDLIVDKRERLERQVGNLSKEIKSKKAIKGVYETKNNMKAASFYNIFLSISQESSANLSLSEIGIYEGGKEIIVNGLSRTRSGIPNYFKRLKGQASFADTDFGLLKINYLESVDLYEFSMLRVDEQQNEIVPIMSSDDKILSINSYVGP